VTRSPVDVLAGRSPEGDGRHCGCICGCLARSIRVAQQRLWWWYGLHYCDCCCARWTGVAEADGRLALSPMAGLGRAAASDVAPTYTYVDSYLAALCTIDCSLSHHTNTYIMRSFFLALFLGLLGFVSALSAAGSNLLVVVDDEADKGKYSTFWSDLTCKQRCRINAIRHS
jgi:hypothetical protein